MLFRIITYRKSCCALASLASVSLASSSVIRQESLSEEFTRKLSNSFVRFIRFTCIFTVQMEAVNVAGRF
ncbi:hypothetical protein ECG_05123 [Echinococcus granulosus]|uniref:Secreted protein n=1 Tax=Echinococcus granulosus TaxID=6210 RepID=A0A068X1P9_ECHGR|nr:hypothetical protein ECG_05123 [Echinococcus granulosus]CDS24713.1 hypothetical protein EgrG_000283900 [Echinococcus granulosus]